MEGHASLASYQPQPHHHHHPGAGPHLHQLTGQQQNVYHQNLPPPQQQQFQQQPQNSSGGGQQGPQQDFQSPPPSASAPSSTSNPYYAPPQSQPHQYGPPSTSSSSTGGNGMTYDYMDQPPSTSGGQAPSGGGAGGPGPRRPSQDQYQYPRERPEPDPRFQNRPAPPDPTGSEPRLQNRPQYQPGPSQDRPEGPEPRYQNRPYQPSSLEARRPSAPPDPRYQQQQPPPYEPPLHSVRYEQLPQSAPPHSRGHVLQYPVKVLDPAQVYGQQRQNGLPNNKPSTSSTPSTSGQSTVSHPSTSIAQPPPSASMAPTRKTPPFQKRQADVHEQQRVEIEVARNVSQIMSKNGMRYTEPLVHHGGGGGGAGPSTSSAPMQGAGGGGAQGAQQQRPPSQLATLGPLPPASKQTIHRCPYCPKTLMNARNMQRHRAQCLQQQQQQLGGAPPPQQPVRQAPIAQRRNMDSPQLMTLLMSPQQQAPPPQPVAPPPAPPPPAPPRTFQHHNSSGSLTGGYGSNGNTMYSPQHITGDPNIMLTDGYDFKDELFHSGNDTLWTSRDDSFHSEPPSSDHLEMMDPMGFHDPHHPDPFHDPLSNEQMRDTLRDLRSYHDDEKIELFEPSYQHHNYADIDLEASMDAEEPMASESASVSSGGSQRSQGSQERTIAPTGAFVCRACNKAVGSDRSLRRHYGTCKAFQAEVGNVPVGEFMAATIVGTASGNPPTKRRAPAKPRPSKKMKEAEPEEKDKAIKAVLNNPYSSSNSYSNPTPPTSMTPRPHSQQQQQFHYPQGGGGSLPSLSTSWLSAPVPNPYSNPTVASVAATVVEKSSPLKDLLMEDMEMEEGDSRSSSNGTTTITTITTVASVKPAPNPAFACGHCNKQLCSMSNLKRHRATCKAIPMNAPSTSNSPPEQQPKPATPSQAPPTPVAPPTPMAPPTPAPPTPLQQQQPPHTPVQMSAQGPSPQMQQAPPPQQTPLQQGPPHQYNPPMPQQIPLETNATVTYTKTIPTPLPGWNGGTDPNLMSPNRKKTSEPVPMENKSVGEVLRAQHHQRLQHHHQHQGESQQQPMFQQRYHVNHRIPPRPPNPILNQVQNPPQQVQQSQMTSLPSRAPQSQHQIVVSQMRMQSSPPPGAPPSKKGLIEHKNTELVVITSEPLAEKRPRGQSAAQKLNNLVDPKQRRASEPQVPPQGLPPIQVLQRKESVPQGPPQTSAYQVQFSGRPLPPMQLPPLQSPNPVPQGGFGGHFQPSPRPQMQSPSQFGGAPQRQQGGGLGQHQEMRFQGRVPAGFQQPSPRNQAPLGFQQQQPSPMGSQPTRQGGLLGGSGGGPQGAQQGLQQMQGPPQGPQRSMQGSQEPHQKSPLESGSQSISPPSSQLQGPSQGFQGAQGPSNGFQEPQGPVQGPQGPVESSHQASMHGPSHGFQNPQGPMQGQPQSYQEPVQASRQEPMHGPSHGFQDPQGSQQGPPQGQPQSYQGPQGPMHGPPHSYQDPSPGLYQGPAPAQTPHVYQMHHQMMSPPQQHLQHHQQQQLPPLMSPPPQGPPPPPPLSSHRVSHTPMLAQMLRSTSPPIGFLQPTKPAKAPAKRRAPAKKGKKNNEEEQQKQQQQEMMMMTMGDDSDQPQKASPDSPLDSIITSTPLSVEVHHGSSNSQEAPGSVDEIDDQESTSPTENTMQTSASRNKTHIPYLCPECGKKYSCRKNVKRHRMAVHKMSLEEVLAKPEQPAPPEPESAAPVTSAARRHTVAGMEGLTTTPKSSRTKRKASAAVGGLRRGSGSPPKKGKKAPNEEEEEEKEVKEEEKIEVKEEEILKTPPPPAALPQVGTLLSTPRPEPFWAAPEPPMFQPSLPPLQLPPPPPNAHPSWQLPSTPSMTSAPSLPQTPSEVPSTPSEPFTMMPSFSTPLTTAIESVSTMEVGFGGAAIIARADATVEFLHRAGSLGPPMSGAPISDSAMTGALFPLPPPEDTKQQRMAVIVSELRQFAESEVAATPKEEDVFDNMLLEQLKEWNKKKGAGQSVEQPAEQPAAIVQLAPQAPPAVEAPQAPEIPPVVRTPVEPTQLLSIEIPEADSTQFEEETSSESEDDESERSALGSVGPQLPLPKPKVPVAPVIPNKRGNRQTPRRSNEHTCTGCGKKLGTDYSLRRHRLVCANVQRNLHPTYPKQVAGRAERRRLNKAKTAEAEIKRMEMLPAPAIVHECVHEFNAERGTMSRPLSSPREAAMANGRTSMRSPESSPSSSRSSSSSPETPSPPRSPRYAAEGGMPDDLFQ